MATVRWLGTAANVAQVSTVTVAGTWLGTETATVTCGGASVTVRLGTGLTTTQVAEAIGNAIAASDTTTNLESDETRNVGGQTVPQFAEILATNVGSVVYLTGRTAGKPFTVTVAETSTSGTLTLATPTAASGAKFASVAQNWEGGALPATDDIILFDSGAVDCCYGLDAIEFDPDTIYVRQGYTGKIGLPEINRDNVNAPYAEYRERFLQCGDDGANPAKLIMGEGSGQGSAMVNFEFTGGVSGTALDQVQVINTGTAISTTSPQAVNVRYAAPAAADGADFLVSRGSVRLQGQGTYGCVIKQLRVGFQSQQSSDASVVVDDTCSIEDTNGRVTVDGGSLTMYGENWRTGTSLAMTSGTARLASPLGQSPPTASVYGGTLYLDTETTITNLNVSGTGAVRFDGGVRQASTVTNCTLGRGASLYDTSKLVAFSNGVDLDGCGVEDVTIQLGKHLTITPSAI